MAGEAGAERIFRTEVSLDTRYDTNANVQEQGDETSDFVFTLSPRFSLDGTGKKTEWRLGYSLNARFFANNENLNDIAHIGFGSIKAELGKRTTMTVGDKISYTPNSSGEGTGLEEEAQVQLTRTDIFYNNFYLSLGHSLTNKTVLTLSASDSMVEFADPTKVDTRTDSASLSASYSLMDTLSTNVSYGYSRMLFDLPDNTHTDIHSLSVGINSMLSKLTSLSMSGGTAYTSGENESYEWLASVLILKDFKYFAGNSGFVRKVTHSAGVTSEINVSNTFTLGLQKDLSRQLSVKFDGFYSKNKSKPSAQLDNTAYAVSASGRWQFNEWLSFSMGFAHSQQWAAEGSAGVDQLSDKVYFAIHAVPYETRF